MNFVKQLTLNFLKLQVVLFQAKKYCEERRQISVPKRINSSMFIFKYLGDTLGIVCLQDAAQLLADRFSALRAVTHLHVLLSNQLRQLSTKLANLGANHSQAGSPSSGQDAARVLKACLRKLFFYIVWLAAPPAPQAQAVDSLTAASAPAATDSNVSEAACFGRGEGASTLNLIQTSRQLWDFSKRDIIPYSINLESSSES
jgi:hypothetical protein